MCPQVWTLTLSNTNDTDTLTAVDMSDLVLYLEHSDPGLRGGVARLICKVLRGATIESGGKMDQWFLQTQRGVSELVSLVEDLFSDSSSITVRQLLSGASDCIPVMLLSDNTRLHNFIAPALGVALK